MQGSDDPVVCSIGVAERLVRHTLLATLNSVLVSTTSTDTASHYTMLGAN